MTTRLLPPPPPHMAPLPGALRYQLREADGRRLLACDPPGGARIVEALGDVATADHIAVLVPGNGHHQSDYFTAQAPLGVRAQG